MESQTHGADPRAGGCRAGACRGCNVYGRDVSLQALAVRMADHAVVALLAALALASAGCTNASTATTTCTNIAIEGLAVGIEDAVTRTSICGALVVATDGAYSETLTRYDISGTADGGIPLGGCSYYGATERAGTYVLTVTAPGYRTATVDGVTVTRDACHVMAHSLIVQLDPG